MTDCPICVETEPTVECPWCAFAACSRCLRRIFTDSINAATCCNCRKAWTDEFLSTHLGSGWFHGKYRDSSTKVLLDRQRAMFAATMPDVELTQRKRKVTDAVKKLTEERRALQKRIAKIRDEIYAYNTNTADGSTRTPTKEPSFRCSTPDCRGFVTRSAPECAACDKRTCWTCLSPVADDNAHTCDPDAVATAREMRKCTVACPGCNTRIQRSEGCDQMFCVVCHIAFNYRTGERDSGPIHNPHYTALLNELGGDHGAAGGGECREYPRMSRWRVSAALRRSLHARVRVMQHITAEELPRLTTAEDPMRAHRVRYLIGEITEARLASLIKRTDFDVKIKDHYAAMFRAFVDASRGVLQRMDHTVAKIPAGNTGPDDDRSIAGLVKELDGIVAISNEAAKRVGELYKRRYFAIPTDYSDAFRADVRWTQPTDRTAR